MVWNLKILSEALIKNQTIIVLQLYENDLGDGKVENLKILSEALIKNQKITILNLGKNNLGSGKLKI